MNEDSVRNGADLFGNYKFPEKKETERGLLLKTFAAKLGWSIPRVAHKLQGMHDLKTLYHIKSVCDSYEREGKPWGKCFNGMLKSF